MYRVITRITTYYAVPITKIFCSPADDYPVEEAIDAIGTIFLLLIASNLVLSEIFYPYLVERYDEQ